MKVSDFVASFLVRRGVTHVYYLIGGMITHLVDSMYAKGAPRVTVVHHEQAAAFAAEGAARMTGVPGVAMATSGPGAVNLLTGVGSCYFDSIPAVFITGQVNRSEMRASRPIRQLGFQETEIVAMARPVCKAAWLANEPRDVPAILTRAFDLAVEGRPGPVLIDMPMDVQRADIEPLEFPPSINRGGPPSMDCGAIVRDLLRAKAPLVLAGGGIRSARCADAFRALVERLRVPVVHSLQGVDLLPYSHPCRVGLIGTYGNRWANRALALSDFLLVLGSRLDIRQTGADTDSFRQSKVIHHVDVDVAEINNRVAGCHPHVADLALFMEEMLRAAPTDFFAERAEWLQNIATMRKRWPDSAELRGMSGINPNEAMHVLSKVMQQAAAYVVDVGNHQMWAAQSLELLEGQRFLTSAGMGSMGFALPAALGVASVSGRAAVVVVAGDGGFQCNIQELQTMVRNQLNLKIVVVDNASLGMVRQFQESYFASRLEGTLWGYSAPDFVKVAEAYGVPARMVDQDEGVASAFEWLAGAEGPALLRLVIPTEANAYPKVAFGRPIAEMEPNDGSMETGVYADGSRR